MENFYFVSDYGKATLPTKHELDRKFDENGEKVVLVLDSSVCLDIINLIKYKKDAKCDKIKIFNLIEYAQRNGIKHFTLFALLELCYDRNTLELQSDKYADYKNMIDYAFQFKIKKLKKFDYNFLTDCFFLPSPNLKSDAVKLIIYERINLYYLALLKINAIASKGIDKKRAEKNVEEFLDWMCNELRIILGAEYIFALGLFGGNNGFRTMIKLGAAKERVLKSTWGTAWDLLHSRMSVHKVQMSQIMSETVQPIFVTKDSHLFSLISPEIEHYTTFDMSKLSISNENLHVQGYPPDFIEKLNRRLLGIASERNGVSNSFNPEDIILKIEQLEDDIA